MADEAAKLLAVYLNDHLAGSAGAIELVRRSAREHSGTELGRFMSELEGEIEADRATLKSVMDQVGARPDPLKLAVGWVAEKLGRLKLNGQLLGRSPLTPMIELEALVVGIHGKLVLWRALRECFGPSAFGFDLDELVARAERQEAAVERHRLEAARRAFVR